MFWRNIASNALTLFIVILAAVAGLIAWGQRQFTGPGPLTEAACFEVPRGGSIIGVADRLAEQGAITHPSIFRIGANYREMSDDLKFGSFLLPPGASMEEILGEITRGGQSTCGTEVNYRIGVLASEMVVRTLDPAQNRYVEVAKFDPATTPAPKPYLDAVAASDARLRVTLAEGATSWQVAEALKRADFLSGEVAEVPAEGTLAPFGYEVSKGTDRAALIAQMQARQTAILADLWAARADNLPYASPEEALVMASIVEKETGVAEERGQVASVFVNRLRAGMPLQTDPTVIYGVTKGQGSLGRGLRASELRTPTPYNTYTRRGLPPTPIANPGREAIMAALNPDTTPFLYFVADGTGGHAFARTLAEHNDNVARWRQIERQQGLPADVTGTGTGVAAPGQ